MKRVIVSLFLVLVLAVAGFSATQDFKGTVNGLTVNTTTVGPMTISGGSAVSNPSQPAFLAIPAAAQENIAIDGLVTVVFGTEVFDQGNNFASNTFTAPVTGKYLLSFLLDVRSIDSAANSYAFKIVTTNRTYDSYFDPSKFSGDFSWSFSHSVLVDMAAGHTATVKIWQSGGTQQTDIQINSWFSGFLVC